MNRIDPSVRRWRWLSALVCALALTGCQSLDFPWASSDGLPQQWEPDTKQANAER